MSDTVAGKLLVAMPGIGDPRFDRSVILMCVHTSQQSMGLILNRPKDEITLSDVLDHLGISANPEVAGRIVLDGGPVQRERGYVLHSKDFAAGEATQDVALGVRLTATRDILEAVAGEKAPERFVLALGYAGWGAGQLEDELKHNAWLVAEPDEAIVFGERHERKWESAIRTLGIDPSQLTGDMGRA